MHKTPIWVTHSSMPSLEEYTAEIAPLWETHMLTNMGEKHHQLEADLERYLQVDDIALFTNGHNALECVFEAMGLKGKVITTPFTFASTTHAIVRKGLTPVFADIKADDFTIDPASVLSAGRLSATDGIRAGRSLPPAGRTSGYARPARLGAGQLPPGPDAGSRTVWSKPFQRPFCGNLRQWHE